MPGSYQILVFAQNQRGVLERITMLIRKKMYNLEQITASDTQIPDLKRLTITFSHQEEAKIPQIISQIQKIVEVTEVKLVNTQNSFSAETALIKIRKPEQVAEITSLADIFKAEVVQATAESLILQVTGATDKIDSFLSLLTEFEILELGRTGAVAMEK